MATHVHCQKLDLNKVLTTSIKSGPGSGYWSVIMRPLDSGLGSEPTTDSSKSSTQAAIVGVTWLLSASQAQPGHRTFVRLIIVTLQPFTLHSRCIHNAILPTIIYYKLQGELSNTITHILYHLLPVQ